MMSGRGAVRCRADARFCRRGLLSTMMIETFERRLLMAAGPLIEQGGLVVVEAEHYDANISRGGKAWTAVTSPAGFAGAGGMAATPNSGAQIDTSITTSSPELQYKVIFSTPGV